ncbi:TolC family protein [Myroides sp. LJL119]
MRVLKLTSTLAAFMFAVAGLFSSFSAYGQDLSFSQAYQKMNQNNSSLKAAEKQAQVESFKTKAVQGLRYPSVKAYGMGLWTDRSLGVNLNGLRNGIADFVELPNPDVLGDWKMDFNKRDMVFGGFEATLPIFVGGKVNAAVKASKIEQDIALVNVDNTQGALISELAERYFMVKLAQEAVQVRKQVLKAMEKHLEDATKLEDNGMIAPVEKLVAQVAVSDAKRELEATVKDATMARIALANTLEIDQVPDSLSTDFFLVPDLQTLEFYKESAQMNFPLLQKIDLERQLAQQGVKVAQSGRYPALVAFGQTILAHNNPISGLDILYNNNKPWTIGVGLTYNLFEGFKTKNEIRAAKATVESVELMQTKAVSDVKMLVSKLYQDIEKQQELINNLKLQQQLAQEYLRVRTRAFSEGFASSTDVVDAEVALSVVKLLKIEAHFQYAVELAALFELAGVSQDFLQYTN